MTSWRPRSARCTSITPAPPMPHIIGSTTPCTRATVTAASTALPPARRTACPASAATGWGQTTIPLISPAPLLRSSADVYGLAADEARLLPAEERDRLGDVDRLADAAYRRPLGGALLVLLPLHAHAPRRPPGHP